MKKYFILLSAVCAVLLGCSNAERWKGYVYPDKQNMQIHYIAGEYKSLEECERSSTNVLKKMNSLDKGYYECAKNCKDGSSHYSKDCEDRVIGNYYK